MGFVVKKILVLDDLYTRVDYLCETFPEAIVHHSTNVTTFFKLFDELKDDPDLKLIILDHDLDMDRFLDPSYTSETDDYGQFVKVPKELWQKDRHGLDGKDAANGIPKINIPIIVWSQNTQDGSKMEEILRIKGNIVSRIPFNLNLELLVTNIETVLKH